MLCHIVMSLAFKLNAVVSISHAFHHECKQFTGVIPHSGGKGDVDMLRPGSFQSVI